MIGINLSGAEFGSGSTYGVDYAYPSAEALAYYAQHGVSLVRLPFKWERMQSELGGSLNAAELMRLKSFLTDAAEAGIQVIVDLHNYGRYGGNPIGTAQVTYEDFADFWKKLASELKDFGALVGYDIMNEPHDMGQPDVWPTAAQAAVDAIRSVDMTHAIYVEGDQWGGAWTWQKYNNNLIIHDPANNLFYEAHQYFDKWASGTYTNGFGADGAYADIGVDRLQPFLDWLKANDAKGFIGEFGVPSNDPQWLEVLDRFLSAMETHGISGTVWGGGFWWAETYALRLGSPKYGDTAALQILQNYGSQETGLTKVGTGAADVLSGGSAADLLDGGAGNDRLLSSAGHDRLRGGAGVDTVDYATSLTSVDIDLTRETQNRGDAQGDRLDSIENVIGSGGADTLRGDAGTNRLSGGSGDDLLEGRGNGDYLDGGAGQDAAAYTNASGGVSADLAYPAQNSGDASSDVYVGIENLIGSAQADRLRGNASANRLWGQDGDDELRGRGGADAIDGGAGRDLADYQDSMAGVDIDLSRTSQLKGDAAGDTLVNIESLRGSNLSDALRGDAAANEIEGGGGNDTIDGRGGADRLDGGSGVDIVTYAGSAWGVIVDLTSLTQRGGDAEGDTLLNFETIIGSSFRDSLSGGNAAEALSGGAQNDLLEGRGGADRLDGGAGIDTANYGGSSLAVNVDLQRASQLGGDAQGDVLVAIENVIGSSLSDVLGGDASRNELVGGGGSDFLNGRGDKDSLTGGAGADRFVFDSAANASGDRVTDFNGEDFLDFSAIDANPLMTGDQAFALIGSKLFTGQAGQLRIFTSSANNATYIQGDLNGDKVGDFLIQVDGIHSIGSRDLLL